MTLEDSLQEQFGFRHFRPGQKALVEAVLAGQDALGILPTGSGKTLCYQLPGRLQGGLTVVVEPLLALMDDQMARLQTAGEKRVVALSSRLRPQAFNQILRQLETYRFLFVAPETLMRQDVLAALQRVTVTTLVVDEAHCISQWGPDFRPAYLQLGAARQAIAPQSVLALTATAPKRVQQDIVQGLALSAPKAVIASVNRPQLFLGVETLPSPKAQYQRVAVLVRQVAGPQLIYFDSRTRATTWAERLNATGKRVMAYHAGLDSHTRALIQRQFMAGQLDVICATSAFGMGIDKPDIRLVVYTYVPESLEAYTQGIGRAGRDGAFSASLVAITDGDWHRAERYANTLPHKALIERLYADQTATHNAENPHVALIAAYMQAGFSQEAVEVKLQARLAERQAAFSAIKAVLTRPECKRQAWLRYFDAQPTTHDALCCGPLSATVLAQVAAGSAPKKAGPRTWQAVFQRIFKPF